MGKEEMNNWDEEYWVVEALLAVNLNKPRWSVITADAVEGFFRAKGKINEYWLGRFWTDVIAWDDEDVARKEFGELTGFKQTYDLRLVRVHSIIDESVVITVRGEKD